MIRVWVGKYSSLTNALANNRSSGKLFMSSEADRNVSYDNRQTPGSYFRTENPVFLWIRRLGVAGKEKAALIPTGNPRLIKDRVGEQIICWRVPLMCVGKARVTTWED